jgi:hypothetical protein
MSDSACLNCRLLLTFMCLLMLLIALTLKINQTWSHISWFLIFLPVWTYNSISFVIILYLIFGRKWLRNVNHAGHVLYYSLCLMSSCIFAILLCMKFEWKLNLPYWLVFIPLWIFILLIVNLIVRSMYRMCLTPIDKAI